MEDKQHMVDITVIGKEGCSGSSIVQGNDKAPFMTLVEIGGSAIQVATSNFKERLPQMPYLDAALARYNLLLLRHSGISVGCSQFHSPPERLARWLKAHWPRTGLESFPFSSDFLAAQAGLDPKTTADILKDFEHEGLIEKGLRFVKIAIRKVSRNEPADVSRGRAKRQMTTFAICHKSHDPMEILIQILSIALRSPSEIR